MNPPSQRVCKVSWTERAWKGKEQLASISSCMKGKCKGPEAGLEGMSVYSQSPCVAINVTLPPPSLSSKRRIKMGGGWGVEVCLLPLPLS